MRVWKRWAVLSIGVAIVAGACSSAAGPAASTAPSAAASEAAASIPTDVGGVPILAPDKMPTVGPNGEEATNYKEVALTPDEVQQIKGRNLKAAIVWYTNNTFFQALDKGIYSKFAELGIQVVAETQYEGDSAKLKSQMETVMALKPDILLTLTTDPSAGAEAYKAARDAGVKIVMLSTVPKDWVMGKDFVGMVTGDHYAMAKATADSLAKAMGETGNVGFIFTNQNFFVTNRRDQVGMTTLVRDHPGIKVVAVQGVTDQSDFQQVAGAMLTAHPEINGFYVSNVYDAGGVLAALRAANRTDVKVTSIDMSPDALLDMAQCGMMVETSVEHTAEMGETMAIEGASAVIGKSVPIFTVVDAQVVTRDNEAEAYQTAYRMDLPQNVKDALSKPCPAQ